MSYLKGNRDLQDVFGVILGALVFTGSIGLFYIIYGSNTGTIAILRMMLFLATTLISGIVIGLICYRKDGYIVTPIIAILSFIVDFIVFMIINYNDTTSSAFSLTEALAMLKFGPGLLFSIIGCFLGIFIKYKAQKGVNFKLQILEMKDLYLEK